MSVFLHGIYSPDAPLKSLHNKGALLRQNPDKEDHYLAQFDARHLYQAFGWHSYPKSDFINLRGGELRDE